MKSIFLFIGGIGMQELLVIGLFILIFFGARKIPDFMKGLGKGMREFKEGMKDVNREEENQKSARTNSSDHLKNSE